MHLSVVVAYMAGLASFLSPCIVPLVPSYLSALAGTVVTRDNATVLRGRVLRHAVGFIAGFTLVLVASGLAATGLGQFVRAHQRLVAELGGIVMVVFGLDLVGAIRLDLLNRTATLAPRGRRGTLAGAFSLGLVFAAGWTPCIGPIAGSILILAAQARTLAAGGSLLFVYALGLATPFLALAFFLDRSLGVARRLGPWLPWVSRAAGLMLVALGVSLLTGFYGRIPAYLAA